MKPLYKIFLSVVLGITFNILVSYFLLPRLDHTLATRNLAGNYYNRDDIYRAIYSGLILTAIELTVVIIFLIVF